MIQYVCPHPYLLLLGCCSEIYCPCGPVILVFNLPETQENKPEDYWIKLLKTHKEKKQHVLWAGRLGRSQPDFH